MADRVSIDIEGYRPYLEKISKEEERPLTHTVRALMREALSARGFQFNDSEASLAEFLQRLQTGDLPTDAEIAALCQNVGLDQAFVKQICGAIAIARSSKAS
jgi:hypothetical protein